MSFPFRALSFVLVAIFAGSTYGRQTPGSPPEIQLPAANRLDALGLGSVPRAAPGTWADLFRDHQPDPERMAGVTPQVARLAMLSQAAFGEADYPRCLAQSREVLRILPDFPPSLLVYGSAAFRLRRYGDCKVAMERFSEVAPSEIWRTQILGHSLYSLGFFREAREHYLAVIEGAPRPELISTEARRGLALAHYRLGDETEALAILNELVRSSPDHGDAWAWLAQIQFDGDALGEALASAREAMELLPFEPRPFFLAFRILNDLGEDKEALALEGRWRVLSAAAGEIQSLNNRLLFHPGDPKLLRALGAQYRDLGNLDALAGVLARLMGAEDLLDPRGISNRIFAIEAFRDAGGLLRARELLERTAREFPGASGLPEIPPDGELSEL